MKKEELATILKDEKMIVYNLKGDNQKFIDFLAERIIAYSIHPFIHDYVRSREIDLKKAFELAQKYIKYRRDPSRFESIISPVKILKEHIMVNRPIYGDCDDKVLFLGSLLSNMGYRLRVVGAFYPAHGKYKEPVINHVYLEYYDEDKKKWIPLEPTATYTEIGQIGYGVIPLYRVEIAEKQIVSKEIVPVGGEKEMVENVLRTINLLKNALDQAEKFVKEYAERRGIRYKLVEVAMTFNQWIRSPLTWALIGLLGVSIWFNLAKIKKER